MDKEEVIEAIEKFIEEYEVDLEPYPMTFVSVHHLQNLLEELKSK